MLLFVSWQRCQHPHFSSLKAFRRSHAPSVGKGYRRVLLICQKSHFRNWVTLLQMAQRFKLMQANVKAMSYERLCKAEDEDQHEMDHFCSVHQKKTRAADKSYGTFRDVLTTKRQKKTIWQTPKESFRKNRRRRDKSPSRKQRSKHENV